LNNKTVDYKIFAVFVLNSKAEDDGGYVYNIFRKEFASLEDFDFWVAEARQRSVVTATTDVLPEDNILTLVTGCDDFEDARLIVMARSAREDEVLNHTDETATISKNPKYPKKWYENRNIAYPF